MNDDEKRKILRRWRTAWLHFIEMLEDLGEGQGQPWDPWALAVFLDVPSFALAGLLPKARAAGLLREMDLVGTIRDSVRTAMARLEELSVEEADEPLRLEFGMTELLLEWEWIRMEEEGADPSDFFERLREFRLRLPEVALCERTTHRFLARVPKPRIL